MTSAALAQSQSLSVPRRPARFLRVSPLLANIALLAVAGGLGIWCLIQTNATIDKGYRIREAQKQVRELEAASRVSEVKLSEMETMSNLTAQAASLGMVPVGTVEYVSRPGGGVALR